MPKSHCVVHWTANNLKNQSWSNIRSVINFIYFVYLNSLSLRVCVCVCMCVCVCVCVCLSVCLSVGLFVDIRIMIIPTVACQVSCLPVWASNHLLDICWGGSNLAGFTDFVIPSLLPVEIKATASAPTNRQRHTCSSTGDAICFGIFPAKPPVSTDTLRRHDVFETDI